MKLVRHIGACVAAATLSLGAARSASAQEIEATQADEAPPSRSARGGFELKTSGGWAHASVYGVPIDLFEAQVGLGAALPISADGIGVELNGLLSWKTGRTEAGRTLSGFDFLGFETVLHYRWVRAGLGARVGYLAVQRSTRDDTESSAVLDGYFSLGVEPFAIGGNPVFVEGQLHGFVWGDSVTSLWLGAGIRFCGGGGGCPR